MKRFLSPKQAADSMGVSESSLKRWCDRGLLEAHVTGGGHRKICVTTIVQFVRESQRQLLRPELLGLPAVGKTEVNRQADSIEPLASQLTLGEFENARQLVFGHYLNGQTVAEICDDLLAPALAVIGNRWKKGDVEIYEEHGAVQMTHRLLSELAGAISAPNSNAPVAIGGTPEHDIYCLPTRMIELALQEAGWNATSLGTSLPFSTMHSAVQRYSPKLVWLSVSSAEHPESFDVRLASFSAEIAETTTLYVGGRALADSRRLGESNFVHCDRIQHLVEDAEELLTTPVKAEVIG